MPKREEPQKSILRRCLYMDLVQKTEKPLKPNVFNG